MLIMENMITNSNIGLGTIDIEMIMILPGIYLTSSIEDNWTPEILRSHGFTHIIRIIKHFPKHNDLNANVLQSFSHHHHSSSFITDGFEILDLNFGSSSYLTLVLPNCYKAVKFIDNAMEQHGAILIIDSQSTNTNEKCITIVVGYLMYKHNLQFSKAFQLVKKFHPNFELDRFYATQLHEYEPILQVQRTLLFGNSCSRELRSSELKRKFDERHTEECDEGANVLPPVADSGGGTIWTENRHNIDNADVTME